MKNKLIITALLSMALLMTACSSANIPASAPRLPETEEIGDKVDIDLSAPKGITVNVVNYEVLQDNIPEELSKLIDENMATKGYLVRQIDGEYYVVVFMGEQPSGGYGIEITSIEDNEGKTNITVKETRPAEDDMVITVITYPYQVVKILSGISPDFKVVNEAGEAFEEIAPEKP
jgi:hypothetical protein